nr:uncharacterized protein LOC113391917 [Vanessa tameamea]
MSKEFLNRKTVNDLNFIIQNQIVGTLHSFKSIDCVTNVDEATNYPTEFLNSLDVTGLPSHNLGTSEGRLGGHLDSESKPTNETRLVIRKFILKGKLKDELVLIPMIPTDMPFEFKLIQLPIRLAFTNTINH